MQGGWRLVCTCRVLQGLTQAFIYPSTHHLVSQWMPLQEKGILTTIVYAGQYSAATKHKITFFSPVR